MPKFVPRQRKHKVIARRKAASNTNGETNDANSAEILPQDVKDRAEQKRVMKDELLRDAQGKMSGKKKKRLDKYIVCSLLGRERFFAVASHPFHFWTTSQTNLRRIQN
jgi:ATP-dependent RNA helicase DHX37/DHR1